MPYRDFTLDQVEEVFGAKTTPVDLFPGLPPVPIPPWLEEALRRGRQLILLSEKARSEFIIAPILLVCRELAQDTISIYSGQNLNVDPDKGLTGECDFILARTPPLPVLRAPLVTIAEAKRGEIELGLGQCAAQMIGAQRFNEKHGHPGTTIYGCVTSGELWQFLRLEGNEIGFDRQRYVLKDLGAILAVFRAMLVPSPP